MFWKVFKHKKRVLLLTAENKRYYKNLILDLTRIIEKECTFNMFETLKCTLKILLLNEEEAYLSSDGHQTDLLTQIALLSKVVLTNCEQYKAECQDVECNTTNETCFQKILKETIENIDHHQKNVEFKKHLDVVLKDF